MNINSTVGECLREIGKRHNFVWESKTTFEEIRKDLCTFYPILANKISTDELFDFLIYELNIDPTQ